MILFSLALLPLVVIWLVQVGLMRKSDLNTYQTMIEEKKIASSSTHSPTNQHRKCVQKDIWFTQDNYSRLHYKIASENSILTLTPVKNKFEVVETLKEIKCWMQDKLLYEDETDLPLQQARYFEAKDGVYRHSSQEFIANSVALSMFRLSGHSLPTGPVNEKEAFLSGVAHNISFQFGGKTPQFQANQFKAMVNNE